ncbi:MAG: tyrosine-type recombinase/integrase [Flavobacteriales bacterium]|nr:tyrosine-type recombinase/integrase [Flavobacteriales bacterium]
MATKKRFKTKYAGVFYLDGTSAQGKPEKIYYIRYRKDGKMVEEKAGRQYQDDMTPARAAGIRAQRIDGEQQTNQERRKAEQAEKEALNNIFTIDRLWEEYSKQRTHNANYQKDKNRYEKYVKPPFGKKEVQDIYPLDVDRVRLSYLKTHSPQTTKHILALLKRLINFGVKKALCPPLSFIIEMPTVDNIKDDALSEDQLKALFNAIEEDDHPHAGNIMLLALFTGMRRGSLFNLKWDDIDFERGFITLRDPKPGKDDIIPLNDQTRSVLEDHIKTDSEYVFPGRDGNKRTNAQKSINKIKEAAGLPKETRPLHSLRHTFASLAVSSGEIDLYTLQRLTTHKTFAMLQRYAHLADKRVKQGGNAAGDAIEKALKPKEGNESGQKVVNIQENR